MGGVVVFPGLCVGLLFFPVVLAGGEAPTDDEADAAGFAGGDGQVDGEKACVLFGELGAGASLFGGIVDTVFEGAVCIEVFPVDFEVVEPGAAEPVLLPADVDIAGDAGVGGEGQVAVGGVFGLEAVGGEMEGVAPGVLLDFVQVCGGQGVGEHADDGVGEIGGGGIGDAEFEEGGGDSGVVFVGGDEGVEGGHPDLAGEGFVPVGELGEWELAAEVDALEVGQAGQVFAAGAPAECAEGRGDELALIGRVQVAVEDAGVGHLAVIFGADGEVGEAVYAAFVGTVEDFPVDEASVAGEADAAGADAAEREADLVGFFVAVDEVLHLVLRKVGGRWSVVSGQWSVVSGQ